AAVAFDPAWQLVTDAARLQELVLDARRRGRLTLLPVTETSGQRLDLIGLGLALEPTPGFYVPLAHRYVGVTPQIAASAVRETLAALPGQTPLRFDGHDLKHARVALATIVVEIDALEIDALLAGYLLDPEADN